MARPAVSAGGGLAAISYVLRKGREAGGLLRLRGKLPCVRRHRFLRQRDGGERPRGPAERKIRDFGGDCTRRVQLGHVVA